MITKICRYCAVAVNDEHDEETCRIAQIHPDRPCPDCGHWMTEPVITHRQHCGQILDPDQTHAAAEIARAAMKNAEESHAADQ